MCFAFDSHIQVLVTSKCLFSSVTEHFINTFGGSTKEFKRLFIMDLRRFLLNKQVLVSRARESFSKASKSKVML
jgi:hypothetical protein